MNSSMTPSLTAGQALVKLLSHYGVDTVFGIPGVHTLELYRGLPGSDIRHVLTRHEQGAGFMADGYARSTGKPGVCFLITGPGVTNAATAIGQAYADSVPLLIISSVNARHLLGKGWGNLHECKDQQKLTDPITALSAIAQSTAEIPQLIGRAFEIFGSERPRPVHISVPLDILAAPIDDDWSFIPPPVKTRAVPESSVIQAAVQRMKNAKRPALIVGGGAVDAATGVIDLAERLQAPVFTTVAGKGIMPADHALSNGSTLCVAPGWDAVAQADLIIAIGTEMADTDHWREELPLRGDLLRIDIDPGKMHDRYPADLGLLGDAKMTLSALLEHLPQATGTQSPDLKSMASPCRVAMSEVETTQAPAASLSALHLKVLRTLESDLPAGTRVVSDMTQLAYSANYLMRSPGHRRWLHPTGYGTLGYGLPAAIGAQIACPDTPVLCLVGDGGLLYTLTELATAQEEVQGTLVVLLWNNEALGQIRDDMISLDIPPVAVLPRNPDFLALAAAFGCHTERVCNLPSLRTLMRAAWQRQGVTFIELTHAAASQD